MGRRVSAALAVSVMLLLGLMTRGVGIAGATTPTQLVLSQSTAFTFLGHSCGGIQEQVFATGFDPASGFPVGEVSLKTSCGGSGRGGGYHTTTYSAWAAAVWDFTGVVVTAGVQSAAPTGLDPAFSAVDANGNEIYNQASQAFLTLAPTFVPAPRITGISSSQGPAAGGTSVTITGTGFTGVSAVTFGDTPAAFVVNGDTSITTVSPTTVAGTVDITVTSAGGPSSSSAVDQFTFVAAPSVSGLSPESGPVAGGTLVTISGLNFTDASTVMFGDTEAAFTVTSDTTIVAQTPAAEAAGTERVSVGSLGGTSAAGPGTAFVYLAPLRVTVSPRSGPPATTVTVAGRGFTPGRSLKVTYRTGLAAPKPISAALCTTSARDDGTFSCKGRIPGSASAGAIGRHTVTAQGSTPPAKVTTVFTLT